MAQTVLFAETIRGMKKAFRRQENDDVDSDDAVTQYTNRGNKLKRNASHVREGRLDNTGGRSYRRRVEHAGYQRYIIQPKPLRYDDDGDVVDDDDDPNHEYSSPVEDDPWAETRLEQVLGPLTSPAHLSDHPALSVPFTAKALTNMAENARHNLHRERHTLYAVKKLLWSLRGDDAWIPVGKLETEQDILLFDQNAFGTAPQSVVSAHESAMSVDVPVPATALAPVAAAVVPASTTMEDSATLNAPSIPTDGPPADVDTKPIENIDTSVSAQLDEQPGADAKEQATQEDGPDDTHATKAVKGVERDTEDDDMADHAPPQHPAQENPAEDVDMDLGDASTSSPTGSDEPNQHRMTTRARAQAEEASPSPSPAPSSIPSIHNFFNIPRTCMPDRDWGLPATEAEDTRKLLLLFSQKQEQVVREAEQLLEGLLKANRLRKDVWRWCRTEPHVGEMSDGEDWYDRDEWGLDADLVKGKEEEEVEEEARAKGRRRRGAQH